MSGITSVEIYICDSILQTQSYSREYRFFFSASASIVDFGSMMEHGMRIQISHRVRDQMRTQNYLAPFSIIILTLSDVCESTQGICELPVGETTRLRNDRLPSAHVVAETGYCVAGSLNYV